MLTALPDPPALWLALGRQVGLITLDSSGERLVAAPPEYWAENAVHLPQMVANGWLSLRSWQELEGAVAEPEAPLMALSYLRPALMLWLSALDDSEWVALDDLAEQLTAAWPAWSRTTFADESLPAAAQRGGAASSRKKPRTKSDAGPEQRGIDVLEAIFLGAAYSFGLVRVAEAGPSRRRVLQLSPLGRYCLALGPAPAPRPIFDQFLFVQPNFEVIAYRQGLTPQLIGQLSQFAWWSHVDAALSLKLTRESIVHGLERGATPESMLKTLTRHSQRPLPPGVVDAVKTWATRRERVTYYRAATLIEFGSSDDRDSALESWPASADSAPLAVADRFLLVENDQTVPFDRLRLTSSRDYRRAAEACVTVEADGVSLSLDPARADLLVDVELARFADLEPTSPHAGRELPGSAQRRYVVSPRSLRRALDRGMTSAQFTKWFQWRTGGEISPAIQLLFMAKQSRVPALKTTRIVVLKLPGVRVLDGLLQHPATSPHLGERLGPSSVAIPEAHIMPLRAALKELGIDLELEL